MAENPDLQSAASGSLTLPYLQFAAILLNGLEKLAEIQKSALSIFTGMAKDSAESVKPVIPIAPMSLIEMAEQAIREFLQIQVRLLDLMLSQSTARPAALQNHSGMDYEWEVARLMRDSTDCLVTMQKKAVEFITHQNQTIADEIMQAENRSIGSDAPDVPDTSAIIEAQKKFWDVTLKPFRMMKAGVQQPGEEWHGEKASS